MTRLRFIAETGLDGSVEWVWRFGPKDRIAHPVCPSGQDPAELAEADFHGASEAAIREWLARPRGPVSEEPSGAHPA